MEEAQIESVGALVDVSFRARGELLDRMAMHFRPHDVGNEIDCLEVLSHSDALRLVGEVFCGKISLDTQAIGGPAPGADPISIATAWASLALPVQSHLRWFSVRHNPKRYGQKRLIDGNISDIERVAIVGDRVTHGRQIIRAVHACQRKGLRVVQVVTLIDLEVGGMDMIRRMVPDVPVDAVFTQSEIRVHWAVGQGTMTELAGA